MSAQVPQTDNDLQGLPAGLLGEFREDANEIAPGTGVPNSSNNGEQE
jgi:hypothetical protein